MELEYNKFGKFIERKIDAQGMGQVQNWVNSEVSRNLSFEIQNCINTVLGATDANFIS